jgi:hypothetical protein
VSKVESEPLNWSIDHPFPANSSGVDQASAIMQTNDGKMWMFWDTEVLQGQAIFYSYSSDYGLTWSPGKNLTDVPNSNINVDPSAVQLSNGTIMVVYASKKLAQIPSDFEIAAHPPQLTIPTSSSKQSNITVTSLNSFDDTVTLSYRIGPPSPYVHAALNPQQVTPPPNGKANSTLTVTVDAEAPLRDYTVTVTGKGPPPLNLTHQTWVIVTVTSGSAAAVNTVLPVAGSVSPDQTNDNYTLCYRTSNDNGASWSREITVPMIDFSGDNLAPSIIQAADSTIWLAWTSTRFMNVTYPVNSEIFYKTSPDGTAWSDDIRLTYNASTDARPSLAQMRDGRIWLAWHSKRYDLDEEIIYNIYNGTGWLGETRFTSNAILDTAPAILQSQDEVIRMFWSGGDPNATQQIYYEESVDNGGNWSSPIPFTADGYDNMYPAVTQSVDARIWVTRTTSREDGTWDIYYRTSLIHNIAVTHVIPAQVKVYQQETVNVSVTVENQGDYDESTITVFLYANTTFLDSETIALNTRTSTIVAFAWNTLGFARGNYTMKAEASAVAGEVYVGDNVRIEGDVVVKLLGDVDGSCFVEVRDLWAVGKAYGSIPGSPNWNEEADLNGDNAVNRTDVSSLSGNYGSTG